MTFYNKKLGFRYTVGQLLINLSLPRTIAVGRVLVAFALRRGSRLREVKISVNVWAVKKTVALCGGSTTSIFNSLFHL